MKSLICSSFRLALALASACPSLYAATFLSPFQPGGSLTLSAEKGLDFDGWDGRFDLHATDPAGNSVQIHESVGLRLRRLQDYFPQWKLDQQLTLEAAHPFSEKLEGVITGEAGEFRDQFASHHTEVKVNGDNLPGDSPFRAAPSIGSLPDEQRIRDGRIGAGGRWKEGALSIEALIGFLSDNRGLKSRSGLRGDFSAAQASDSLNWIVSGWLARFPDGSDHDLRGDLKGEYSFGDDADDRFGLSYASGRRFEISMLDIGGTRRDDERLNLSNQITVAASKEINFLWESEVNNQTASRTASSEARHDREFIWKNGAAMRWTTDQQRSELSGGIDVQQQKYAGSLTEGQRSRLGLATTRRVGSSDSLNVNCSVLKYRYDTPDERDHNDRDELRTISGIALSHQLTSAFSVRAGIGADLSHIVYISGARSGENRWTRQFSLFAETPWRDPPVANIARYSIISHYTDYDFAPFDETASRVFRTASATDTLQLDFGKGWNCELSMAGELNDHGSLVWDEWIQNVAEEGYSYTVAALPGYDRSDLHVSAGWVFHKRYSVLRGNTSPTASGQSVRSRGPMAMLTLKPSPKFTLEASGTSLRVHDRERGTYTLPDLRLTLNWVI